eukprot:Gregarina_sp_Pseudo_9__79@NODE_1053_length_1928_cov_6_217046_g985_i0_p1_GENE_NODE_1053_length_1928_cov_6_217046_g985_i0NODE_1053_length_1928_cov_6_217046_g985_i0_p1_ORF_typecomplete_len409_score87_16VATC/PF18716_1/5_5e10_NODE_1053_length_1928_cov_6_217046_g985_i01121338
MLVTAFDKKAKAKEGLFLPCEFLFGNFDHLVANHTTNDDSSRTANSYRTLNPCADVSNLSVKIPTFQDSLRDALSLLQNAVIGLPVDCHMSQPDFDALVKQLSQWTSSSVNFVLGANPDWKLLGRLSEFTEQVIESEVARLVALIQTGRQSKEFGFVKFGFLGCVSVTRDVRALQIACRAASQFSPVSPVVVVSFAHCENEALIDEAIQVIEQFKMEDRVIVFVPRKEQHKEKILAMASTTSGKRRFRKIFNCSPHYDIQNPVSGELRCAWPNQGCCVSFWDLRRELERELGRTEQCFASTGIFFKSDHNCEGGLGLKAHLILRQAINIELGIEPATSDFMSFDWKPPFVKEVIRPEFQCDVCKKFFPLETGDEPYRKFDFVYCSITCLATHRKAGWSKVSAPTAISV